MSAELQFKGTRALVIDSNKALRDATLRQLADLGVSQLLQSRGLADSRRLLEKIHFDFVLCADVIEGSGLTGQTLLEELQRDSLLPHTTVFAMLAGQATYLRVMEAAEAALDCFVLRPVRTDELAERLLAARHRKRALAPVFEALNRGDIGSALWQCQRRHESGGDYALLCGRLAAELMLKAGRVDEALALFRTLETAGQTPWSSLGVARALLARGDMSAARRQVHALLEREPDMPEALDVLGRVTVELGELPQALDAYRRAVALTPQCMLRLQHCGTLAWYQNEPELALQTLDRARSMDMQSRLFDAMTLLLLALLHSDRDDARGLASAQAGLQQYAARYPGSARLRRMVQAAAVLLALNQGKLDGAQAGIHEIASACETPEFDLEAANILLSLWVRLPAREIGAARQERLARSIGLRFCVSRSASAVLLASARRSEAVTRILRDCQAEIAQIAETAMRQALQDDAGQAIRQLLERGAATHNARLIALAGQLLKRHGTGLADADALRSQVATLQASHCRPITHIAGIRRSGRSTGGLLIRMQPMAPAPDAAPLLQAADTPAPTASAAPLAPAQPAAEPADAG